MVGPPTLPGLLFLCLWIDQRDLLPVFKQRWAGQERHCGWTATVLCCLILGEEGYRAEQRVDLTTDGLWAMPLNEGWVPVMARRLQDWQKLKKYVPIHKQGDVCPNGVPALPEKRNGDNDSDSK